MVDIQSATAEIRRGKKKKKEETGQKYNVHHKKLKPGLVAFYDIWPKNGLTGRAYSGFGAS